MTGNRGSKGASMTEPVAWMKEIRGSSGPEMPDECEVQFAPYRGTLLDAAGWTRLYAHQQGASMKTRKELLAAAEALETVLIGAKGGPHVNMFGAQLSCTVWVQQFGEVVAKELRAQAAQVKEQGSESSSIS